MFYLACQGLCGGAELKPDFVQPAITEMLSSCSRNTPPRCIAQLPFFLVHSQTPKQYPLTVLLPYVYARVTRERKATSKVSAGGSRPYQRMLYAGSIKQTDVTSSSETHTFVVPRCRVQTPVDDLEADCRRDVRTSIP